MKAITIAVALAAASAAIAAPHTAKRDLYPISATDLVASYYDQTKPETTIVSFKMNDPNTNIDTPCDAAWYVTTRLYYPIFLQKKSRVVLIDTGIGPSAKPEP